MANPYRIGVELAMSSNHAQVLGALSHSLLGIHPRISALEAHFGRLGTAITGAIGVFAGKELLTGLWALTRATKELSDEKVALQKLGLNDAEVARVQQKAIDVARNVKGMTQVDVMKIIGETYNPLGLEHSLEVAERLAKLQTVMKGTTGKWSDRDSKEMYDMVKSAEIMGQLTDPKTGDINMERFNRFLDVGAQAVESTHGRVSPKDWLNLAKQGGPSLMDMDPMGLRTLAEMTQMLGGHRVGTASMSLFQQMSGVMPKRTAIGLESIGMLQPGEWKSSGGGGAGGGVILTDEAKKRLHDLIRNDPLEFTKKLKELMEAKGITSPEAKTDKLFDILSRQTTQRLEADLMRNMLQIEGARQRQAGALPMDAAVEAQNKGSMSQNIANLTAAWKEFQFAIAEPATESTIGMLQRLTGAFRSFTDIARGMDPKTIEGITTGIAGLGIALVGGGAAAILAALGPAGWLTAGIIGLGAALAALKAGGFFDEGFIERRMSDFKTNLALLRESFDTFINWLSSLAAKVRGFLGLGGGVTTTPGAGAPGTPGFLPPDTHFLAPNRFGLGGLPGGLPSGVGPPSPTTGGSSDDLSRAFRSGVGPPSPTVGGASDNLSRALRSGAGPPSPPVGGASDDLSRAFRSGAGPPSPVTPGAMPFLPQGGLPSTSIDAAQRSLRSTAPPSQFSPSAMPFTPIRYRGGMDNAISPAGGQRAQSSQPIVVSLNIDGRKISEALSSSLAEMMEFPTQAPYHDAYGGYAPPDNQLATT